MTRSEVTVPELMHSHHLSHLLPSSPFTPFQLPSNSPNRSLKLYFSPHVDFHSSFVTSHHRIIVPQTLPFLNHSAPFLPSYQTSLIHFSPSFTFIWSLSFISPSLSLQFNLSSPFHFPYPLQLKFLTSINE